PFIQRILYLFSSKSARENMGFILPWSLFGVGVNMLHAGFLPISVPIQASHHNTGYFSKKKKTCISTNYRRICKSYV
ncbi:MAG: hypothetical protein ACLS8W_03675, partial [Faecalibacterium prausnitzii]